MSEFEVGQAVKKVGGYPFPGVVIGKAVTLDGKLRYVVETVALPGLCHIFAPEQLTADRPLMTAAEAVALGGKPGDVPRAV